MSASLGELLLSGAKYLTGEQPYQQAQTAKTWAEVPLVQAQTAETQAKVPYWGAETGFVGENTIKQQLDNEWNRLILNRARPGLTGQTQGTSSSGYQRPADEVLQPPPQVPSGGGGGGGHPIGPGTPGSPGETTSGLTAFAAPPPPPPGSQASMLAAATPPPPQPGPAAAPPMQVAAAPPLPQQPIAAPPVQMAQAGPGAPGSAALAASTPLGFGGGTAGGGPMFLGQTATQPAAQPVAPPAAQPLPAGPGSAQLPRMVASPTRGSPAGTYLPGVGVVPTEWALPYYMAMRPGSGVNPSAVLDDIKKRRQDTLMQLASGANDPETWKRNTEYAFDSGLLSEADFSHVHANPQLQSEFIRGLLPTELRQHADDQAMSQGMSWNPAVHNYAWDPAYHAGAAPQAAGFTWDPVNKVYVQNWLTPNELAAGSVPPSPLGPTRGAPPAAAPGTSTAPGASAAPGADASQPGAGKFDTYKAAIHTHEGDSATMGPYGFIPSSKVSAARQFAPEEVAGKTDAEIAQMQLSPQAWDKMLQGFTAKNAVTLEGGGMRASTANLGMAHYIGAQGVLNLRKVSPDTTMTQMEQQGLLVPGSVAHNPELQGNTTARGFIQWAQGKYGNTTMTADDISGATKVAGPGAGGGPSVTQPATPPQTTPPAPRFGGKPELGPGVAEMTVHNIQADNKAVDGANDAAQAAQGAQRTVRDMLDRTPRLQAAGAFGYGGEFRTQANSLAHMLVAMGGKSDLLDKFDSWNFNNQTDREAFIKEAINLATQQEAAMPGVRSGIGLTTLIGKGTPSLNMQGDTVRELLNRMLVGHMMTQDYANGLNDRVQAAQQTYNEDPFTRSYAPVQRQYDREWNDPKSLHNANVYLGAATLLTDGGKTDDWKKRLSPKQRVEAVKLARRVTPDWVPGQ